MSNHYCEQWGPEKLREIKRGWEETANPPTPAPPIANVALALELASGLDAEREFGLRDVVYLFHPTPYGTALRIWAWSQQLGKMEGLAKLIEPAALHDWAQLPELRQCYEQILSLAGSILVDQGQVQKLMTEAEAPDVHDLVHFLLDPGDEVPIEEDRSEAGSIGGVMKRYDCAHYLFAYFQHFGAVPGMVVLERGRPAPTSWRHFQRAGAYLRRSEAIQALVRAATAMGGDDKIAAILKREAGYE